MGYTGYFIELRLQKGQSNPSEDELAEIHNYFDGLFHQFCKSRLSDTLLDYFEEVSCAAIHLEQKEISRGVESLWELIWLVYDDLLFGTIEHWLLLFVVKESQNLSRFGRFEVVPSEQTLKSLVFSKPEYSQYITLKRGFYLLDLGYEEMLGIQAAAGIAPEDFAPDPYNWIRLQFFTPKEQASIRETLKSSVCMCPICASLRKELENTDRGIG